MFFQVTSLSRASGRSAPAAAAYRAGERLRDEARGRVHNHSARRDVEYREIITPAGRAVPDWARERNELWNRAEATEVRPNARVAREYLVALPQELSPVARTELARRFAQDVADRYGTVVDLATHLPRPAGDPRNFHAHVLSSTREIGAGGFGAKAAIEWSDRSRRDAGLVRVSEELKLLRGQWASRANEALRDAGLELRLDPRSLREQGIDRAPQPNVPMAVVQMERRGIATDVMRSLRHSHPHWLATERSVPEPALSLDERAARAIERWLAYRAQHTVAQPDRSVGLAREAESDTTKAKRREHDLQFDG